MFKVEGFNLPFNYSRQKVCELCEAGKSGPLDYANFLPDAPWLAAHRNVVDVVQSIADQNNGIVSELVHSVPAAPSE